MSNSDWQAGYDKGRADASVRIDDLEEQNQYLFEEGCTQRNRIAKLEQHVLGLRKALAYKDERIAELETAVRQWEIIHAALGPDKPTSHE